MINRFLWTLLLASSLQVSWGFSLAGPVGNGGDGWQTPNLGYGQPSPYPDTMVAPKNLGEEYRLNVPVLYYAFNANFLDYFGTDGASAVDGAFAALNVLTNVDSYSKSLTEIPLQQRHVNYQAQALGLVDLKSETLVWVMPQLGLADPVRYSWTLHDRRTAPGGFCPDNEVYLVVQRNIDIISSPTNQLQYSPYVNSILYSYNITEKCPQIDMAQTSPFSVDPLAAPLQPIASAQGIGLGDYLTGLTRDDVAGVRYLLTTNNVNTETPASRAVIVTTNANIQQLFPVSTSTNGVVFNGTVYGTSSYGQLLSFSSTNAPNIVQATYPGLQFTFISNYFATVTVTNTVSYFTNVTGAPADSPVLVTKKVTSTVVMEFFNYHFDNIITNIYSATTIATNQTIKVGPADGAPIGSPSVTNITKTKVTLNEPFGEFAILPASSPCGLDIVSTLVTFTNYTTNLITSADAGTTSSNFYAQIQIVPFVGHVYVIHPVTCEQTNAPANLYRGIGGVRFVRADFDSLLGQFWQPVTNDYTMVIVTNSKAVPQQFRRVATTPDYLITAADISLTNRLFSSVSFNQNNVLPNLAGPGTVVPTTTLYFEKGSPAYYNTNGTMTGSSYFLSLPGANETPFYSFYFVYASFDGTTNTPVIFPNGTSIENLENQIAAQVSPASLPFGIANAPYPYNAPPVQFTAMPGAFTQPFTWSENDGVLNGIGLTLNPATGDLSGVPTQSGTFDFTLRLTDVNGRTVHWPYSITIQ